MHGLVCGSWIERYAGDGAAHIARRDDVHRICSVAWNHGRQATVVDAERAVNRVDLRDVALGAAAHDCAWPDDRPGQCARPYGRLRFVLRLLVCVHPAGLTAVIPLEDRTGQAARYERSAHENEPIQPPAVRGQLCDAIRPERIDEARLIKRS